MDKDLENYLISLTADKLQVNDKKLLAAQAATAANKKAKEIDPEGFFKKRSNISKKSFQNPERQLNHKKAIEQRNNNPEYKKNITLARKIEAQTAEGRARRSKQTKEFLKTEKGKKFKEEQAKKVAAKAKPLITEFGVFRSVSILSQYILDNNVFPTINNKMAVGHKIRKLINDNPANYFYISVDDYELCLLDKTYIEKLKSMPVRKKLDKEAKERLEKEKKITQQNIRKTKNNKPIVVPWGIFLSKAEAVKMGVISNIQGNIEYKIKKGLDQESDVYRYITQEEYILLTGKEL